MKKLAVSFKICQKNWQTIPDIACDGGTGFLGAIFDPETDQFSQLAINEIA